jgi:hypothetical protein
VVQLHRPRSCRRRRIKMAIGQLKLFFSSSQRQRIGRTLGPFEEISKESVCLTILLCVTSNAGPTSIASRRRNATVQFDQRPVRSAGRGNRIMPNLPNRTERKVREAKLYCASSRLCSSSEPRGWFQYGSRGVVDPSTVLHGFLPPNYRARDHHLQYNRNPARWERLLPS